MSRENYVDVVAAVTNPATVRAMLEDYRGGLHVERRHDEQDRAAGRRITCPTPVAARADWPALNATLDQAHAQARSTRPRPCHSPIEAPHR